MDATTLENTIATAATEPASASVDGQSATGHSLRELIDLEKHEIRKRVAKTRGLGVRFVKLTPPGMF
jgi:hypothetical protein